MKKVFLTILALLSATLNAEAAIQEITTMPQILPYVNEQTLLVFDLDNTVIEPLQTLGSDQWFKSLLANGNTVPQAIALWEQVQKVTKVQAVESVTPQIIRHAQEQGLRVMALTARPSDLATVTERQLASVGVDFQKSPPAAHDLGNASQGATHYTNGIEYIGPSLSKGQALVEFLSRIGWKPQRVVFVDDLLKHNQTVNASLDQTGIENYEFRYGAADSKVQAFSTAVANMEFRVFHSCDQELISDSTALGMVLSGAFHCASDRFFEASPNDSYSAEPSAGNSSTRVLSSAPNKFFGAGGA